MGVAPILTTDRLILRMQRADDWGDYASLMMSERAVYMGGAFSVDAAWGMFCHDLAQWSLFGHGALMMERRDTGLCLGQVGINAGPLFPEHELGWLVYPEAEGQGLAFEAAVALRDGAFETGPSETLVSYIDPLNTRSCALAERLGATLDGTAQRPDPTELV